MKTLLILLGCVVTLATAQRRPPNYSQDEMPDTSFDCRDKVVGGYYADQETDCQMFHVCVKVPGIGVQDYRFLCPNDTTFDQENQICANWYDIDCEASTLYYSDNFDLYRIDKGPAASRTPIPLGPSTQRPPAALPKKRPVTTRDDDEEEEFYLQRSETGDRRLQKDLLRGSSSGNFFNKNKGKDDDDEDDYKPTDKKPIEPQRSNGRRGSSTDPKKKVAVRKLRKRPENEKEIDVNAQQSYDANPTTYAPSTTQHQTHQTQKQTQQTQKQTQQTQAQTQQTQPPQQQTQQTQPPQQQQRQQQPQQQQQNNNNNRFVNRQNNRQSFRNTQVEQNANTQNFEPQKSAGTSTTLNNSPSTAAPVFNERTTRTQYQPRYNTISRSGNNNNNNNNNVQTTTTTQQPEPTVNNPTQRPQLRNSRPRFSQQRNNFVSKSTTQFAEPTTQSPPPTTRNYYTQSTTIDDSQPRGFEVQKIVPKNAIIAPTTIRYQNLKAGFNNNNNFNNQNSGSFKAVGDFSRSTVNTFSTTIVPVTYNGNYKFSQNVSPNVPTTTTSKSEYQDYNGNFDSYGNQRNQGDSDEYVETVKNGEEEFLKTAPSNNIRPSNFNSFSKTYTDTTASVANNNNNQKSSTNFNYNSKNNNDFSKITQKSFNNEFRSTEAQFTQTNPTTRRPSTQFYQSTTQYYQSPSSQTQTFPTTYAPLKSSAFAQNTGSTSFYQPSSFKPIPSTTQAPQVYKEASKVTAAVKKATEAKLTNSKVKDASYDYAYYDDTEYEGADPISDHHFGVAGESQRISPK